MWWTDVRRVGLLHRPLLPRFEDGNAVVCLVPWQQQGVFPRAVVLGMAILLRLYRGHTICCGVVVTDGVYKLEGVEGGSGKPSCKTPGCETDPV